MTSSAAVAHELQARIRELEALRKSRAEETQRIIASQRTTIDRLRAENQKLSADLAAVGSADAAALAALVASGAVTSAAIVRPSGLTAAQSERADKLMEVADTYNRKIEVEQRQLESLEREVEMAQAQVLAARRDVGGHSGTQALTVAPVKAVKALETRLDAAQRRFNEHIAANRDLKQQIDAATRRQAGMEQVRAQLEREVAGVAAELATVHEAGRVAAAARQEAEAQAAALRVAEDAEAAAFDVEVRELAACQEADAQLLAVQAARLTRVVEAADAAEGDASGGGGGGGPAEPLDLDSLEQGVGVEAAAAQLQHAAGLSSLPETLAHYSRLEGSSFELFAACNEANERIAAMGREARELEAEIRALEAEGVAGRQHEAIRAVLGRRDAALRRADSATERRSALERRVAMLRAGVYSSLRKLGAAAAADAWHASAPGPSGGTQPPAPGGPSGAAAAAADPASRHPVVAACAHVMAGLALLEQRAAAIISVQGTMVGRTSSLTRSPSNGRAPPPPALPSSTSTSAPSAAAAKPSGSGSLLAAAPAAAARAAAAAATPLAASSKAAGGPAPARPPGPELIQDEEDEEEDSDGEDEMPLTREQIQARAASMGRA